jgi:hypothetical protein
MHIMDMGEDKMPKYEIMREIVENMNEYTVLDYNPQKVVVDIVENFFFAKVPKETIIDTPIDAVETVAKDTYLKSYPTVEETLLQAFADDVIFYMAFRLSKQGGFGSL